jgi:uncharacterized protein (DUF362 family)
MKRRDFLRKTGQASISALLFSGPALESLIRASQEQESYSFAIVKGRNTKKIVEAAIQAIGGMKKFVSKGDIVMVKPNIGWDRTPEQAANTNPDVLSAIVRICFDAGAKRVKVADNTCNDPRRCYRRSGIYDAARKAGAEVYYLDERTLRKDNIGGTALKSWPVYKDFIEVDKFINVPIAKHHGLTRLTLGMKNLMGAIGGKRNSIHQDIHPSLADLGEYFKPHLTIVDAVRILTANGPQGGRVSDVKRVNTVIAGTDIATTDALAANLFSQHGGDAFKNLKLSAYPFLKIASERGLGRIDLQSVPVKEIELKT